MSAHVSEIRTEADVLSFPLGLDELVAARTAELSNALAVVESQRLALEKALRARDAVQARLEAELEDAQLLHGISAMLVDEHSVGELYQRIVDAATEIMRSDFGSMQRFDAARGELQLIAHQGLNDAALAYWQWVYPGRATTCGRALALSERVVVGDFESCDFIAGSEDLLEFRKAGVRSAQSTPLLTRDGRLVGMITTHWTRAHEPEERQLRLLDIVARQAADLIERNASAAALHEQAERLVTADRYKNEFLATLAHELRNPLAPIRTGLSVLKLGKMEQAPRVLAIMERQLGHMVRLIDDLLDVSRISSGKVTLKCTNVELAAVIDSAVEASRPLISAAGHRFTLTMPGTPVWLNADPTRIAQIVSNLLNNAAKYTPQDGKIDLVADADETSVTIRISDNGIGIDAAMLPRIFDLFTQVDGAIERSQGGLGVGLALARRLAEMHGGHIGAESAGPNAGAVFTLTLPVQVRHDDVPDSRDDVPAALQPVRILVVDTLALLLEQLGHQVRVVLDAPEALA
ncbi:MAG: ATP-binding protein, partial [Telluria sp.]